MLPVEPGEHLRYRRAVAPVRRARAGDLGGVLGGARNAGGVRRLDDRAAIVGDELAQALRRQHRVERDASAGAGECDQIGLQRRRRSKCRELGEIGFGGDRQLALVDEDAVRAVRREDGEAERQRRMRHVAAANIEGPGERRRVGQHGVGGAGFRDVGGEPRQLFLGEFAGKADRLDLHRPQRGIRLVRPKLVDRIAAHRHQFGAPFLQRRAQCLHVAYRMQPRIEAEAEPLAGVFLEPFRRGIGNKAFDLKNLGIDLLARLQRVAAVHEKERAAGKDKRDAGGPAEARQPLQPLGALGDIFALVLVGARHEEAAEVVRREPFAQQAYPGWPQRRIAYIVEGLEHGGRLHPGFECATVSPLLRRGNALPQARGVQVWRRPAIADGWHA